MALWNTFFWSDGTLWEDANGPVNETTAIIDRMGAHYISIRITYTNQSAPGDLSSFILKDVDLEVGTGPQLPKGATAFIDRDANTQRISVRMTFTTPLSNEPTSINRISMLANKRSRSQPTG